MIQQVSSARIADAISPGHRQYVEHWPDWPSSAPAAHGRQHYYAAGPVSPVPDKCALATNKRTNRWTNRQTEGHHRRVKPLLCGGGLISALTVNFSISNRM